jgi:hypothetical protein
MLRYRCARCGTEVRFDTMRCPVCAGLQGYVPSESVLRTLDADDDGFHVAGDGVARWRCLNAAWGCNWTLPARIDERWCLSCALTRGRPDVERSRRHRGIVSRRGREAPPRGPADAPRTPDRRTVAGAAERSHVRPRRRTRRARRSGHLDGVGTIVLADADDRRRDELRRLLGEPFRTLIGNLRHEVGHHYWARLVGQSSEVAEARRLFGDERGDYRAALERHDASPGADWDAARYVSRYATVHPLEDWGETFAHLLHLVDAIETAGAHGLAQRPDGAPLDLDTPVQAMLDVWLPLAAAVDSIAEAVGSPAPFPFRPAGVVVDKLSFVHDCIRLRRRGVFYDDENRLAL